MADEKATFAVELKDGTSGAALSASEALKRMKLSIDDDVKALGAMQRAMKQLQSASSVNVEAYRELSAKIDQQKNKIAASQAEYLRLGGGFGAVSKGAKELSERITKVPGPIGDMARKLKDLREVFGNVSVRALLMGAAIGAAIVGSILLVGAALTGIGKLFSAAINNTDALHSRATRAGGPVISLSRQMTLMKRDFGKLFSGLNLGPFLRGFRELTSMFSQSTASGRALKVLLETALQPLLDGAGAGAPLLKRFFQGIIIAALHVAIVVLTLRNKFRETFGDVALFQGLDAAKVALYAGMTAAGLLLLVLAPLALTIGAIAVGAYSMYTAFKLVVGAATRVLSGVQNLRTSLVAQWRDIGGDIAAGIADGILRGALGPVAAIADLGSQMVDALKEALDIHSPSRVFARLGIQIPAGVAQGVERGAPQMNRTVAELVSTPSAPATTSAAPVARTSSSSVTIGDIIVNVPAGTTDAESIGRLVAEKVASLFEGASLGAGLGVPA